jgi:hypothetical protein
MSLYVTGSRVVPVGTGFVRRTLVMKFQSIQQDIQQQLYYLPLGSIS